VDRRGDYGRDASRRGVLHRAGRLVAVLRVRRRGHRLFRAVRLGACVEPVGRVRTPAGNEPETRSPVQVTDARPTKAKRLADSARAVLNQLENSAELSTVLPTARLVAELAGYETHVYWLDFEIYGLGNVPGQVTPLQTEPEKRAFALYWSLHATQDLREITVSKAFKRFQKQDGKPPEKDWLVPQSISSLENSIREFTPPDEYFRTRYPDEALRLQLSHSDRREILKNVRAYLHRYMGRVWRESTEESENFELLGPDYRFVIDNLQALDTDVGDELKAAVGLLRSDNPSRLGRRCIGLQKCSPEVRSDFVRCGSRQP
jgi:hypothetical protein